MYGFNWTKLLTKLQCQRVAGDPYALRAGCATITGTVTQWYLTEYQMDNLLGEAPETKIQVPGFDWCQSYSKINAGEI